MTYKFRYGTETTSARGSVVAILSPDEQYKFGFVRFRDSDRIYTALTADRVSLGSFGTRDAAAQAVAQWGYDHIKRF